jgi:hypothetical protein
MTDVSLAHARAGDEQAFRELTDPFRRELQVHCYRILGSASGGRREEARSACQQRAAVGPDDA